MSINPDLWLDNIALDDPESKTVKFYGARIPAEIIVLAIASKTSPETIIKMARSLEKIRKVLAKE